MKTLAHIIVKYFASLANEIYMQIDDERYGNQALYEEFYDDLPF